MGLITLGGAKMLAKNLKRILQNEFDEETRLSHCQEAIAEAFDFSSSSEMFSLLPMARSWNREWCVNRLVDEGQVSSPENAEDAVDELEERFGFLTEGLPDE
ncbi:MAG: hypothetical protein V4472_17480 [Pseudomonadota bacterium]